VDIRTNLEIDRAIRLLKADIAVTMPQNPVLAGFASHSQCDEDGIIRECLSRLARTTALGRTFVEIGCGNGLENNTRLLLMDGFRGVWIDGSAKNIDQIVAATGGPVHPALWALEALVTIENADEIAQKAQSFFDSESVDFLSLDIDGNDYYIMPFFVSTLNPKLVCVEYNGKYPLQTRMIIDYDPKHVWSGDDYFECTLQPWIDYFTDAGYKLVSCNLSGVNAFFARNDLLAAFELYPDKDLFQPARYWLSNGDKVHPSSFKWLSQLCRHREASSDCHSGVPAVR
jgi:hypothetical protein